MDSLGEARARFKSSCFFYFSSQRKKSGAFPIPKKTGLRKHNACESEPQLFGVDVSLSISQSTPQFNFFFKIFEYFFLIYNF